MRIGYMMNIYPVPSATFIRREIRALEAQEIHVSRFATRKSKDPLVDTGDQNEQYKTQYLLSGNVPGLLKSVFAELIRNPLGLFRAMSVTAKLAYNAGGGVIRHVAYLLEAVALKQNAETDQLEHIHAHFSTNTAVVALLSHRMGGPGYSFTAHGPDEFVDRSASSLALKINEARFVVAISHFCKTILASTAGMEAWDKIHIVRCGLDFADFPVSEASFEDTSPFVCVGRLCPQKAQVLIVAAISQIVQEYPNIRVQMIGDGESRTDVETVIERHNLQSNVELLGWKDNEEVRALLGQSRALLLPSFAEGLPVAIMEAFALGRPAISTYIAGIPELVDEQCGWIIPAGSEGHIADAIRSALSASPDELIELGLEGRDRVIESHDIKVNAEKLAGHFREAIASKQ
ncbi:Putative teichuronic acid biosynthesis glycosyltransferase TuaC [Roseovarius albus]|uniref:Putative teichuronic acid biosynthesis glycosyltransferase TuaC n=1 Tax=Roseovarius albus TaxID=1247867 RepID=A0A1X6ZJV7_9RHOB|nr:glycosyltransferase family 4 protein [Roseovarius albus]SLN53170.1 Putative teichuronic acid biosynthesis glycosyltransferase TuaC [Roseovarius albus]